MAEAKIIIFSGEEGLAAEVTSNISRSNYAVKSFGLEEMDEVLSLENPDCVVLVASPSLGEDGCHAVLKELLEYDDNLPVVILDFCEQNLDRAVSLMKDGAHDYFASPIDYERVVRSISHAVKLYKLTKRVFLLENQTGFTDRFDDIIGRNREMQEIFKIISTVAKSNATVLILGESGTGKELVAKAIHKYSNRASKPFVDINCGAIPHELLENELFGHERGAYTGADRRYIGSCERANGGTLFLDEICEMDPALQVKILRLLQERSFNRVGGTEKITVDIRFIAATNRNIEEEVRKGNFREDLYYRINVVPIHIPPLRERKDDIILLARHFLEKYSTKNEKMFVDISPAAAEYLVNYSWPGNVRELENVIERIVVLYNDSMVRTKHLPAKILEEGGKRTEPAQYKKAGLDYETRKILPLELVEKYAIEAALEQCGWNAAEAAQALKIGLATIYRKMKAYGLKKFDEKSDKGEV